MQHAEFRIRTPKIRERLTLYAFCILHSVSTLHSVLRLSCSVPLSGLSIGIAIALCVAASEPHAARQQASPTTSEVVFRDIAAAAGLGVTHVNGASPDKYFAEIMGSGGLFFDFDDDGWLDIFLVDGGSIADPKVAARARHRLFRNRGPGTGGVTFEDVTAQSG